MIYFIDFFFRKRIYQSVFEYDLPLFNPDACVFEFLPCNEVEYINPWKESFKQLYKGIHVRPGYSHRYRMKGRNLAHFDSVQTALDYADETPMSIVFLHSGTYRGEYLVIDSDVAIIGLSFILSAFYFYYYYCFFTCVPIF